MSETIKTILQNAKSIAVVGASPKPNRDSGRITNFLFQVGYKVYPVNPIYEEINGLKCYKNLNAIQEKIDIVNIFRNSAEVLPIVHESIEIGAKIIWMQLGVINYEAEKIAIKNGINIIMDKCILIEYNRYF